MARAFRRGSGSSLETSAVTMSSTALSEAEKRMVVISTEVGTLVKYSGNPAELPGARHEMDKCLKRKGAFKLLKLHNACRMQNTMIATENLDSLPFVVNMIDDPALDTYTYANPCPDIATRVANVNAVRAAAVPPLPPFTGVPRLASMPPPYLKIAIPNREEVAIEDHAYALTQLSIFEDVQLANKLLNDCDLSGRRLRALLVVIEAEASGEDVTLVVNRRDLVLNKGLKGMPLSLQVQCSTFTGMPDSGESTDHTQTIKSGLPYHIPYHFRALKRPCPAVSNHVQPCPDMSGHRWTC